MYIFKRKLIYLSPLAWTFQTWAARCLFIFPVLMVSENTVCPKASAIQTQTSNPSQHQRSVWSCLLDLISPFPDGEPSTEAHALAFLCHWCFSISSGFVGVYPGPPVLPLWFTSSFEALWGEFDNDSHSPPHGTDGEGSTTQVWLKQGQRTVAFLGVLYIPCLQTVLTHHFPPTLCTAPSHPKLGGPRSFCLLQLHSGQTLLVLKHRR